MALHGSLEAAVLLGTETEHRSRDSQGLGSPVGEETRRPPTSSRDSTLRLPPPSYLQARNRAQASQTHQSVSLTNHAGAIGLVPHQGRAAWDELSAEEKEGGVSCLPGWHSDSPRPEGGRGVAGGGRKSPNLPVLPESAEGGGWATHPAGHRGSTQLPHTLAM